MCAIRYEFTFPNHQIKYENKTQKPKKIKNIIIITVQNQLEQFVIRNYFLLFSFFFFPQTDQTEKNMYIDMRDHPSNRRRIGYRWIFRHHALHFKLSNCSIIIKNVK